jgi:spore coat protein U-like protein
MEPRLKALSHAGVANAEKNEVSCPGHAASSISAENKVCLSAVSQHSKIRSHCAALNSSTITLNSGSGSFRSSPHAETADTQMRMVYKFRFMRS